jgi:hypothetical protein
MNYSVVEINVWWRDLRLRLEGNVDRRLALWSADKSCDIFARKFGK